MAAQFALISGSSRNLNVQVAREIAVKILSGEVKEGAIIGGEIAMCQQFGVSRTALREAIKLLTSKGMVESRPKVGTRVCCRTQWNMLDVQLLEWLASIETTDDIYQEFLELRRAIEPEATALSAERATKEQRIELTNIFHRMVEVSENFDQDAWTIVDSQFHRMIFISTGNSFYVPFGNVLTSMFKWFIRFSSKEGGVCLKEHRAIYDAIMSGDSVKARQASLSLMQSHKHRLTPDEQQKKLEAAALSV
ncbi:FadR/GntR family transcriptional regulator [Marinobacterium rhizophilum]|uniref:FadR family transcriptional regulator n=1 Tax=Marinobacterium rhizophilum TaxID=420402 RepID=A0ABY5HDT7_9GAMM|nr:FadR/GntR family transcriptional regulator [Marinobacterium rhizophilum]UTW10435.1 FadR family transcriptional regulator [Marinobacterium rhizophilum]